MNQTLLINIEKTFGWRCLALLALLFTTPSVSQAQTAPQGEAVNPVLEEAIKKLTNDTVLRRGQVGIAVVEAKTGQILAHHNAQMSLIPASNMKIVSTAATLSILGNDFKFRTELQYDGIIKDSVLTGNVYLRGYGDPTLGSAEMDSVPRMQAILDTFAAKIKAMGIKKIDGKIVGDGTAFEPATAVPTWLWEDLGNYYGAGPSGLNFNENSYELTFLQNPIVDFPPSVHSIHPQVPDFQLVNEVRSAPGGGDDAYIYATPYSRTGYVRGTIPAGGKKMTITGALPDPPYFAAWHLRRTLRERGVDVTDSATTQLVLEQSVAAPSSKQTFFTWYSPRLATIVRKANLESVNLYCEAFTRAVGLAATGVGSNDKGVETIQRFWQSKGVDTEGLFMQDGSGLSPRNGITPMQLVSMLRTISLDNEWFTAFFNSLPEAGKSGTLRSMFKNHPSVMGRLRAKSGTITRVRSYSGYVTTTDGRLLCFSVMANNFTCSQREIRVRLEQFMADLCRL